MKKTELKTKHSCVYIVRNGTLPYGTTGTATRIDKGLWLFKAHGRDIKLVIERSALYFGPPVRPEPK